MSHCPLGPRLASDFADPYNGCAVSRPLTLRAYLLVAAVALPACAAFVPLRDPATSWDESLSGVTTRAEALARLGQPAEILASDVGDVLVYRRRRVVDVNPNRYYGDDRGDRFDQYDRLLLFLDESGAVVRWAVEPE